MTLKQLYKPGKMPMKLAAFMSNAGSNLRRILELQEKSRNLFEVAMIFTDNPKSNAGKIGKEYGIPCYCTDINEYYSSRGKEKKDMKVRKEYDRETAKLLRKHNAEAVALCGYMSIATPEIFANFITVNLHPADLRILDNGKRAYAGCMAEGCVKRAIKNGAKEIRTTIHLVNEDVDGGPILMVSEPVKLDVKINEIGSSNELEDVAHKYLEKLKENGDWKVYPEAIKRLAEGRFWIDENDKFVIDVVEEKALLRNKMKELREGMGKAEVERKSSMIIEKLLRMKEYKDAKTVLLYMAAKNEVGTKKAIQNAMQQGKKIALPVVNGSELELSRLESPEKMRKGSFGIMEPEKMRKVGKSEIELAIVPGVAFDGQGNRLGQGLGMYDKLLKGVKGKKIGLAYEMQVVDRVIATEDDVAVDKIITEQRVIECGTAGN